MSKNLHTETGTATLYKDGRIKLVNSGYVQSLTKEQVQEAWETETISMVQDEIDDIRGDYDDEDADEIIEHGTAQLTDDGFWDFGEELHIIPSEEEFINPVEE